MLPSVEIWLVVIFFAAGDHPRTLEDTKQPSIEVCLDRSRQILERFAAIRPGDGWEISVACNIGKPAEEEG
jgi:hypothetical protein